MTVKQEKHIIWNLLLY